MFPFCTGEFIRRSFLSVNKFAIAGVLGDVANLTQKFYNNNLTKNNFVVIFAPAILFLFSISLDNVHTSGMLRLLATDFLAEGFYLNHTTINTRIMHFKNLLHQLRETDHLLRQRVVSAISQGLVVRNWLIGHYIVEFEQQGQDYAQYGERLLYRLSEELTKEGMKGMSYTNLTLYRKFYLTYPHLAMELVKFPELIGSEKFALRNLQTVSEDYDPLTLPASTLLKRFSFSHFIELLKVEKAMQRSFYEIEAIKGDWSVRQLRRQIGSLLYERTGLSLNKEALLAQISGTGTMPDPTDFIREPYVFEFLGLKMEAAFPEADLEKALLDHLQQFLLEMGNGFCFEAQQKSFLIDERRYKIDLLFYHRILKCHVVVDLKTRPFKPEDAGQMNFYLNYHRENILTEGDNPPIGIILCTWKNEAVVRYATGALDNPLFVSRYLLQLPGEGVLRDFLLRERKRMGEV